jgi:hypothetical protein
MTTFFDPLSQEKREFVFGRRAPPDNTKYEPLWCERHNYGHNWADSLDDFCKCSYCGISVVASRAKRNLNKN